MNLLQEYENRIDFYRGLDEEEMKQKQLMKQQAEEQMKQVNVFEHENQSLKLTIQSLVNKVLIA